MKSLAVELPAVFGFLFDPTIDATNWRAEQALRPAVVNRNVSGGNRSSRGAAIQQILASVVHIARLRGLDTRAVLIDLLRARQPIAAPAFTTPQYTGRAIGATFEASRRWHVRRVGSLVPGNAMVARASNHAPVTGERT